MKHIYKLLLILFLSISVCANCQNIKRRGETSIKKEIEYDIEHIKYKEEYVDNNGVKHADYFTRCGDTIALYEWKIDVSIIKK